jgi:hypothetical protein
MTLVEFNEKYKDYIKESHYGLALEDKLVIEYLDEEFKELIKLPNFKFSQIKSKYDSISFYADGVPLEKIFEIENKIEEMLKK